VEIAVVGNREGWTYERVKKTLLDLDVSKSDIIITGGARGVDTFAVQFAKEIGAEVHIIHPDPDKNSPQRYYERNVKVVLMSDLIIAFNLNGDMMTGTHNVITQAKRHKKKFIEVEE